MGRRATSTTKGGRFMNPADQERKMARKKELKKNKKQRHLVRQAVLKNKDPEELLVQMEKLDEMEFSDLDAKPLSERVMQEKRNKLRETFIRVLGMYKRENEMEKFGHLRRLLQEYDEKRTQLHEQYFAQKFAREVNPAEIPLPDSAPPPPEAAAAMTPAAVLANRLLQGSQPFPPHLAVPDFASFNASLAGMGLPPRSMEPGKGTGMEQLQSILKKSSRKRSTLPPGPPAGLPPDLSDSSDDETPYGRRGTAVPGRRLEREASSDNELDNIDEEEEEGQYVGETEAGESLEKDTGHGRPPRVRFNDNSIMDEEEEKDSRSKYKELAKKIERGEIAPRSAIMSGEPQTAGAARLLQGGRVGAAIPPPPSLAMMSPGAVGGPPQLRMPPAPLGQVRPGMRMPPPPPPGFPPRGQRPTTSYVGHVPGAMSSVAAVLSAPPALNNKPKQPSAGAVIEAKPQLRNMQQEITRMVPTAVKLRREQQSEIPQPQKKPKGPLIFRTPEAKIKVPGSSVQHAQQKSTDEAYDEFMQEIQTLI